MLLWEISWRKAYWPYHGHCATQEGRRFASFTFISQHKQSQWVSQAASKFSHIILHKQSHLENFLFSWIQFEIYWECVKWFCIWFLVIEINVLTWFAVGMRFPASSLDEYQVKAYWKMERENMLKILDEYLLICRQIGVRLLMFLFAIFLQLIIIVVFPFFIK